MVGVNESLQKLSILLCLVVHYAPRLRKISLPDLLELNDCMLIIWLYLFQGKLYVYSVPHSKQMCNIQCHIQNKCAMNIARLNLNIIWKYRELKTEHIKRESTLYLCIDPLLIHIYSTMNITSLRISDNVDYYQKHMELEVWNKIVTLIHPNYCKQENNQLKATQSIWIKFLTRNSQSTS